MPSINFPTALLQGKCPQCRRGNMFTYGWSNLARFSVMNQACPHCGVRFEPEPGFYQGAMYVGYAITMAVIITISVLLSFLGDYSEWVYIGWIIGVMVFIIPLNYRYSRILYLHFFGGIQFDPRLEA
jgi:uncharacterized protein (DUF983 family)